MTETSIPKPNQSNIKADRINDGNLNILELVKTFEFEKFFKLTTVDISGESTDNTATGDNSYTLYIAENRRHECPKLVIKILDQEIFALIDTGCELSIMNEHLYNRLRHEGLKCFELPTQHVNLLSAFNKKSNRVKKQAMLDVKLGDFKINQIVLLSPQLLTDAILGLDFLVEYEAVINFAERSIALKINGENTKMEFIGIKETTNALEESSSENQFHSFALVPSFTLKLPSLTAESGQYPTEPIVTGEDDTLVKNEERGSERNKGQRVEEQVDVIIPRRIGDRDEYEEFTSRHDDECRNFYRKKVNTLAQDKEGHIADDYRATGHKVNEECREIMNAANKRSLCFTATLSKTNAVDTT
jgi:hypothetical protein